MGIYKLLSQRPPAWGWKSAMPKHLKDQDHWVYKGSHGTQHDGWLKLERYRRRRFGARPGGGQRGGGAAEIRAQTPASLTANINTQGLDCSVFNSSGLSATSSTPAVSGNLHKYLLNTLGFPGGAVGKKPPANAGDARRGFDRIEKVPWSRKWKPTPVFLPGNSKGQRSLASYSPGVSRDWAHTQAHPGVLPFRWNLDLRLIVLLRTTWG